MMVKGMTRLQEISENAAGDQLKVEKYVKELSNVCAEMFRATGCMFRRGGCRFINIAAAAGNGGTGGGKGGGFRFPGASTKSSRT